MPLYTLNQKKPIIGEGSWIAASAEIIGDVKIGMRCWIGPNAVIRGDFGSIIIDDETAVEDGVIIHTPSIIQIGKRVTIGHMAMVHNKNIKDYAVIGMNSTLSDNAEVGLWSIIAEHSLVKKDQIIPDYKIYAGVPASEKGNVEQRHKDIMSLGKQMYIDLAEHYHTHLSKI